MESILQKEPFISLEDLKTLIVSCYMTEAVRELQKHGENAVMLKKLGELNSLYVCDFWAPDILDEMLSNRNSTINLIMNHRSWVSAADSFYMQLTVMLEADQSRGVSKGTVCEALSYVSKLIDTKVLLNTHSSVSLENAEIPIDQEIEQAASYRYNPDIKELALKKYYWLIPLYLYLSLGCHSSLEAILQSQSQGLNYN